MLWGGDRPVFVDDLRRDGGLRLRIALGLLHPVLFFHDKDGAPRLEQFVPADLRHKAGQEGICAGPSTAKARGR